ncbi:hypothetical protein Tsp_04762 [Trichinella spiralis]|uniref:hypothetical protein n=1 Tax=Trichinella spiralis TaxID=6334 RepID=UPI0001EFDBFA|nr:hypothetical protein Tsp_04762 [Trichinella spiralis]
MITVVRCVHQACCCCWFGKLALTYRRRSFVSIKPRIAISAKITNLCSCLSCQAQGIITRPSSSNADYELATEKHRKELDQAAEATCHQFRRLLRVLPKNSGLHAHYKYQRRIIDALTELTRILSSADEKVTVDLSNDFKGDKRTLVFISPDNRYTHETVEKVLPGSLPWQKIGSMACIPMAVKDQGAASDDTHGNAQCSELSAKSLTHHNFFKHKNICEKLKQAEMDPMNSWHMTCLTQAYLLLAQQSILSVFIRFITSSTWAFMCRKGMPAGQLIAICLTGDLKDSAENPAEETMKKF